MTTTVAGLQIRGWGWGGGGEWLSLKGAVLCDAIGDTDKLKKTKTNNGSDACPDNHSICTQGGDVSPINLTLDNEYPTPAQQIDGENILNKTADPSNKNKLHCPIK